MSSSEVPHEHSIGEETLALTYQSVRVASHVNSAYPADAQARLWFDG